MIRPGAMSYEGRTAAVHLQDIYTRNRLTLKLGIRFDHEVGKNNPSQIPANMVIPEIMPAVDFAGTESVEPWRAVSPRLGITYDLTGDGKTLLRGAFGRFYDRLVLNQSVVFINGARPSEVDYPWNDQNGDRFVQANELDTSTVLWTWNFDPENPDSFSSPNVVDPDFSPPLTDEVIVGLEREVIPDFSLGVNYIYRRFSNLVWRDWAGTSEGGIKNVGEPIVGVSSSDFVPVETSFEGQPITYYELPFPRPAGNLRTNWPDYDQRYHGVEVTGWKRLSNRWMLNFGFTWTDHREYYRSDAAVYDPTNAAIRDGGQVYTGTGSRMSSRWNFKLDGLVQLPAGINLAGRLNARHGYIFPQTFETRSRGGGIGRADVLLIPVGDNRYEDLWLVDLRVDKTFYLGRARLTGMVDFFNIFNTATVLDRHFRQNRTNANRIRDILAPRVVRFGVRFVF